MNRYGNEVGCHTPALSIKLYRRIESGTEFEWAKWEDSSWHNDQCDSMHCYLQEGEGERFLHIFLPNSVVHDPDNEEWNCFTVFDEHQNVLLESTDIEEVIKFVNQKFKNEEEFRECQKRKSYRQELINLSRARWDAWSECYSV